MDTTEDFYNKLSRMSVDVCGASEDQFERVFKEVIFHHAAKMRKKYGSEKDINPYENLGTILWYDPIIDDFLWVIMSQDDMTTATSEINNLVNDFGCPIRDVTISAITTVLLQFGIAHEIWSTDTYIQMVESGVDLSTRVAFTSNSEEDPETANC